MIFIQLTGLSGAGKSTLAAGVRGQLQSLGYTTEIIDGDDYRQHLCRDLDFSREGRLENIRRLGFVGTTLARNGVVAMMAAINPYEEMRRTLREQSELVRTVWINCSMETLLQRDTKKLYHRAMLPEGHPEKIHNLTGVNDPFETPENPDLIIHTDQESAEESVQKLLHFILKEISTLKTAESSLPRALFIGRWQPFHKGHQWLIDQKLSQGIPVLVAVRNIPPDAQNPLFTWQVMALIKAVYPGEAVEVISLSDIESVNYGRAVGYQVNEFDPPTDIKTISATGIRNSIRAGKDDWKENVDPSIHGLLKAFLG